MKLDPVFKQPGFKVLKQDSFFEFVRIRFNTNRIVLLMGLPFPIHRPDVFRARFFVVLRCVAVSVYTVMFKINAIIGQVKIRRVLALFYGACFNFVRFFIFVFDTVGKQIVCNNEFLVALDELFFQRFVFVFICSQSAESVFQRSEVQRF